jgi:hypothetical protein
MDAKKIEKEVKVIESVLGVLYRCLTLYRGIGDIRQYRETRADIMIVEKELRLLLAEKEAEANATREP